MSVTTQGSGWPFLVARGRRRGYGVLLAPGWLVGEHGVLEEAAGPVDGRPYRVGTAVTAGGRRLTLVWAEHRITEADVGDAAPPRDEHSRPLRLLYGFVCADATLPAEAAADDGLARSRHAALDTYCRFLADEERFTIERSEPFGAAMTHGQAPSGTVAWTGAQARPPAPATARAAAGRSGPRLLGPALAGLALAAVVTGGVVWLSAGGDGDPAPSCTTVPTTSQRPPATTTTAPPSPGLQPTVVPPPAC